MRQLAGSLRLDTWHCMKTRAQEREACGLKQSHVAKAGEAGMLGGVPGTANFEQRHAARSVQASRISFRVRS